MNLVKLLVVFVLTFIVSHAVYATESSEPIVEESQVEEAKTLTAYVNVSKPQSYKDRNGRWIGFEVERYKEAALSCGFDLNLKPLDTIDGALRKIKNEENSTVFGGLTASSERMNNGLNFSYPLTNSGLSIVVSWDEYKQTGSYGLTGLYALLHLEMIVIALGIFLCAKFLVQQIQSEEAISAVKCGVLVLLLAGFVVVGHGIMTARLQDQSSHIADIHSYEDLAGKVVATKGGSTSVDALNRLAAQVVEFKTIEGALLALSAGDEDIEAVVFDTPVLLHYVDSREYGDFRIVADAFNRQYYAIAFRSEDHKLCHQISAALAEQDKNGRTRQLRRISYGQ